MIEINLMPKTGEDEVVEELLSGLKSEEKHISSKFFYDDAGSELFEEITKLEEYYPPKIEAPLIRKLAEKIKHDFKNTDLVELGSGDCSKISILLDALPYQIRKTVTYVPVDVSKGSIEKSSILLRKRFPKLKIRGIVADFLDKLEHVPNGRKRIFCFFGSTIGNLSEQKAEEFMRNMYNTMNDEDQFIVGMDMLKDISVLEKAYNDKKGITARFNKNILNVVNKHLKTNFNPEDFEHLAFFNTDKNRVEMHLKAKKDMKIKIPVLDDEIVIAKNEKIHTENSQKYTFESIEDITKKHGPEVKNIFTDEKNWFSLVEISK